MCLTKTGKRGKINCVIWKEQQEMEKIILASGSPRRRELLEQIGIPFEVHISEAEETVTQTQPGRIVEELSLKKALAVAEETEQGIILGADTIVWQDDEVLGKPRDREDAKRMIRELQGRGHSVFTGVTIIRKGMPGKEDRTISFHRETRVFVHTMEEDEIEAYLETGEAFDKAGAYGIQGAFAAYVDKVEGDYHTVVGLPVSAVYQALRELEKEQNC